MPVLAQPQRAVRLQDQFASEPQPSEASLAEAVEPWIPVAWQTPSTVAEAAVT